MSAIPPTMRAVALAAYGPPSSTYDLADLPTPKISSPDQVLIKVGAASINPIDVKLAGGLAKMFHKNSFPYKIGYDVAGTIVAVGSSVTSLKVGDEVYSRTPDSCRGTVAQYALSTEPTTALKPTNLSFTQAAAIPLAGLTALQGLEYADKELEGGLKGKTVFIAGGLGGVGSFAVQLARNVFEAGKVITTLSTAKIAMADRLFGQERMEYVDYTKGDAVTTVGKHTVDFFYDTMKGVVSYLPVVKKGGVIVSISTLPSGSLMKKANPNIPYFAYCFLNLADWFYRLWTSFAGVHYTYFFMTPAKESLEQLSEYVQEGKLLPVVGKTAKLSDIKGVREGCEEVLLGKGGLGKFVIEID